jgi:hypothetical protein
VFRLAKATGWGFKECMEDVPFSAGLQILFCDSLMGGKKPRWKNNRTSASVDVLAQIDAALKAHA